MAAIKPTLVLVHGVWEGPSVFDGVALSLAERGFPTKNVTLPCYGAKSPGNTTMDDDIATVRSAVEAAIGTGQTVVLVLHSAGGFIGSAAIEGLTAKARVAKGEKGGVAKIVFITAALLPENTLHHAPPFAYYEDGVMHCKDYEGMFFNDLEPAEVKQWMAVLKSHPAEGWDGTITYCGWRDVPSVYIHCTLDKILPPDWQKQFAALAGSEVVEVDAGHVPMIKRPDDIIRIIEQAASSI
ncbi:alpha/beta-hydrolase [Myriangium duriaei CBS 260.36]|uniref:Alpha/beta-hydrolase n=1 Tax=Myriangium duriaei CBS 260.36 TaxID=1168546 RepID=A0A9P4IZJ6_9PEZI|nr:alpha/beta-hydrolase [Myriangium duriaei CBS 260.36]